MEALRPVPWRAVWDDKRDTEVAWAGSAVFRGGVRRVKLDRWISLRLFRMHFSMIWVLFAVLSPHVEVMTGSLSVIFLLVSMLRS